MDLRQLAALIAVDQHGTFSAAAAALHTVQSNISAHIARLERELGVTLVDRHAGQLTEEGRSVVGRARRVQAEIDAIVSDVGALRHDVAGTVRLGVIGTVGRWIIPRLLAELGLQHPGIRVVVYEGTTANLEPRLQAGMLDVAVVNLPVADADLTVEPLFEEDLVLVVPLEAPLAHKESVCLADLEGVPLLLPVTGTTFRNELDAAAVAAGTELTAKTELDGLRLMASLTFEGHGPAILPATAIPTFMKEQWRSVAVSDLPCRRVGIALRRRGLPSAPARATLQVIAEVVRRDRPAGVHEMRSGPEERFDVRSEGEGEDRTDVRSAAKRVQ